MKKLSILPLFLAAVVLLASCASGAWVSDPYSAYPQDEYICAVGRGKTADEADLNARKELASLFGMAVQSTVSRTLTEASVNQDGKTAQSSSEFFMSNATATVNVDNLYGVEILKRSSDKDGSFVSLAVMPRKTTAELYLARCEENKSVIDGLKTDAENRIGSFKGLEQAVELIKRVSEYNTAAVMCSYLSGKDIPMIGLADYLDLYRRARSSIVLELAVEGDESGAVRSAVSKVLTESGLAVSTGTLAPTAKASVTVFWRESAGTGIAADFIFANYNADVSVIDLAGNETVMVFSSKGKEGHQSFENAKSRATTALVAQIEEEFRAALGEKYTY